MPAHADNVPSMAKTAPEHLRLNHTSAMGADRWCILTFIRQSQRRNHAPVRLPAGAAYLAGSTSVYRMMNQPAYSGATSFFSRLNTARGIRLATLWKGRESSLVLGVDNDGYLGFRLDDAILDSN